MINKRKVVWFEGMTLDPHHFQQWDRYHLTQMTFWKNLLFHYSWGLSDLTIEKEAILNGQLKILKLSGILPDGTIFNLPDDDPLPPARNFSEKMSATKNDISIFLTLPMEKPDGRNCIIDDTSDKFDTRYFLEDIMVNDENTGTDQLKVGVAHPNYQIRFENENLEGFTQLKIAEINRSAEGDFILSNEYIPPCLVLKASENLLNLLRKLLEFFVAKSQALRNQRRQSRGGQLEITANDLLYYWYLAALNTQIPQLNQYLVTGKGHPLQIYDLLISLAGLLSTYSTDDSVLPGELPIYDHNNLSIIFRSLDKKIRKLLGEVMPQKNYVKLELVKQNENLFISHIKESNLFKDADLFVSCSGEISEKKIINELPIKLRIASPDVIYEILSTATRALNVNYFSQPPAGIPTKAGIHYFKLEKQGPLWTGIEKSQSLAIYIPSEFKGINIELFAVKSVS